MQAHDTWAEGLRLKQSVKEYTKSSERGPTCSKRILPLWFCEEGYHSASTHERHMQTITLKDFLQNTTLQREVRRTLDSGGLICLPCNGRYRIIADLYNEEAVMKLFQSKRRVRKAPALVFVGDEDMLPQITDDLDPVAGQLASMMWPGPLTLLVPTQKHLPKKITKQIAGGKGNQVGVRVPETKWLAQIVRELGRPVIVSSANREKKGGDTSPAQIRKNFGRELDLFIEDGDLVEEPSSTVVEVSNGVVRVVRAGAIDEEFIRESLV